MTRCSPASGRDRGLTSLSCLHPWPSSPTCQRDIRQIHYWLVNFDIWCPKIRFTNPRWGGWIPWRWWFVRGEYFGCHRGGWAMETSMDKMVELSNKISLVVSIYHCFAFVEMFQHQLLCQNFDGFTFWQWVGWEGRLFKKLNGSHWKDRKGLWPSWSQSSRLPCGKRGGLGANQADIFPAKYTGQVLVMGSEVN